MTRPPHPDQVIADEVVRDLLRSAWVIESSRRAVYARWAEAERSYERSAARAAERAAMIDAHLKSSGLRNDPDLVPAHSRWMTHLGGSRPGEVALGNFFLARLGDWVDGHCADFLGANGSRLQELGAEERAELVFPSELPPPPPFEPVEEIALEPPGERLFRFGILADLHFGSAGGERMARAAIADLSRSGAELVIQLGDITDQGNADEFEAAMVALGELDMPVVTMMGNHDVYSLGEARLSGREYYRKSFGRQPDGVILEHNGFRFAVLDSVMHAASPYSAYNLVTGEFVDGPGGAIVRGELSVPQHDILAEVAAPGTPPAFVFLHHPPQPFTGFPPILFGLRDEDSGRLHATVDSGNVWGVFAGHTHRNARTRNYASVPAHEVATARDYPFGYGLVDVSENGYAYRFVQLSDEDLLRAAYEAAGEIHRRYGLGSPEERGFVWTRPWGGRSTARTRSV
ncbi:MAG TPA: metallophosphoesterase [Actinomycetota bacterium]|nr:metallophosphoesterase [Actinomycetota bacterium]